jgi:hypothetical protein
MSKNLNDEDWELRSRGRPVAGQAGSICSRCEKKLAREDAREAKRRARRDSSKG